MYNYDDLFNLIKKRKVTCFMSHVDDTPDDKGT